MQQFYPLEVSGLDRITKDATCVSLNLPKELRETFAFKPGQYLNLKFDINGKEERRCYSLCSSPANKETLRIGVKRVKDGLVSNYINDNLKVGDIVEVLPPDGNFFADVKKENYKTYYLLAAGSGITPILSILRTVLHTEPQSYVHMIYGNRDQDSIMFKQELEELQEQFAERFLLVHTLSRPKQQWSSLWKRTSDQEFRKGRVDAAAISWLVSQYPPYAQNVEYYICGPGKMIETAKQSLKDIDVPDSRIFVEHFGGGSQAENVEVVANAQLVAQLNGEQVSTTISEGETILRALIRAGKKPPYSCEGGVCASCKCSLTKGEVHMKNNMALSEEEVQKGNILSCQSVPLSAEVEVSY